MSAAVTRLTCKLEGKLAEKDFYEAHQLYRTIYFRLQRDIKLATILIAPEGGPALSPSVLLENRVEFVEKNPSYTFLLEFLSEGVLTLLKAKELISALDILKLFLAQLNHVLFESEGGRRTSIAGGLSQQKQTTYYSFLTKWFNRLMDVFHAYGETGLEMIQNKSAQSKGFIENDFLSERDQMLEKILQISKKIRVVDETGAGPTATKIKNAFIRSYGLPEMHLRNGKLLMRFQEMAKARHCFLFGQDSFELAKFLYFFHKIHCNETEYEMVLVKHLIRIFNSQLFINAKPGMYRGQRGEKFKSLKINSFSDDEMAATKIQALSYAKEVFYFYLAITKFFLLKDAAEGQTISTTNHFRKMYLLKYFNFYLIILEEFLRQDDIVPPESSQHFNTKLFRQIERNFKFNSETCFTNDRDTSRFLTFFGNHEDFSVSLANTLPSSSAKSYLLKLFCKLRTVVYKDTITFYRRLDRELDFDLMERVFFVYYNESVPDIPEIRDWDNGMNVDALGFFEREEPRGRTGQAPGNMFFNLLSGMAGPSGGGGGGANFMDFLNDLM